MFISPAEDSVGINNNELSLEQKLLVAASEGKDRLEGSLKITEGMDVILTWNFVVSANLANGTQGTVEKIYLDPCENLTSLPAMDNIVHLQYPPALVLFRLDNTLLKNLKGLTSGIIPLEPLKKGMQITYRNGRRCTVYRKQLSLMPAYAFTDYKAQGQTLKPVIVDIGNPPLVA
ncbi:hypothetical protein JB92DRAFT_3129546 [Gautieria morchelliformis]|nr:hypothetical protein JB92DRAFT_3129546 [Gautieria morchelliformis]